MGRIDISDSINQLWDLKLGRHAEQFEKEFNLLKKQLGLELATTKVEPTSQFADLYNPDFLVAFLTLNACCLRQKGLIKEACLQMEELKDLEWQVESKKTRFLYFCELANQAYLLSDEMNAFEISKRALLYAPNKMYSMFPLSTLLLCEENMGIQDSTRFEILLKLKEEYKNNSMIIAFEQLLQSYQIRLLARKGDIHGLLQIPQCNPAGHETYTLISMQQIPFLKFPQPLSDQEAINIVMSYSVPYFRQYWTGTILGLWKDIDCDMVSLNDKFDRLYVWTWKWLTNGQPHDLENALKMINQVLCLKNFEKFSSTASLGLRNILLWMTVCDPKSEETCRAVIRKLNLPLEGFAPLFDYEYHMAEYCLHCIQGRDSEAQEILQKLKGHYLWNSADQILSDLVLPQDLTSNHPLCLIQKIIYYRGSDKSDGHFKIRLEEDLIYRGQVKIVSRPMARGLSLFVGHPSIELKEFAEFALEIRDYDDLGQRRRVFKLLKALREILSKDFDFKIRDGRIHLMGNLTLLQIQSESKNLESLKYHLEWKKFLSTNGSHLQLSQDQKKLNVKSLQILKTLRDSNKALSQKSLCEKLEMKRTTLLRYLMDLKKGGYISQQGAGPTIKYIADRQP